MRRTGKAIGTLAAATSLALLGGGLALADDLQYDENDLVAASGGVKTLTVTTSTTAVAASIGYQVQQKNNDPTSAYNFCNVSVDAPGTLAFTGLPAHVSISDGSSFETCGEFQDVSLAIGASAPAGQYVVTPSMTGGNGGTFTPKPNSSTFTLIILDGTPPIIIPSVSPAANGSNGWHKSGNVDVTFAVSDPNSSITSQSPACGSTTTVSTDGIHTISCTAASSGGSDTRSAEVKRDVTQPAIAISSPASGTSTSASTVSVSGTASDDTSGIAGGVVTRGSSEYPVSAVNWGPVSVSLTCGTQTIAFDVADSAGNTNSASITVTRTCAPSYTATLQQPIDTGVINIAKTGRVVPVKAVIKDADGNVLTDVSGANVTLRMSGASDCLIGAGSADAVETYAVGSANTGESMRYSDGQWIFNLSTGKAAACLTGQIKVDAANAATGSFKVEIRTK